MRFLLAVTLILLAWGAGPAIAQDKDGLAANISAQSANHVIRPANYVVRPENYVIQPKARFLTSLPFTILNGGIILGKVRVDSFPDSLNFIFDTGCGAISLDSSTAERLKLYPRLSPNTIRGIGGVRQQHLLDGMRIELGGLTLDSLTMQVSNYDILSSVYGEPIDGILGYTFFSRYLVKVNYDSSKIDIYSKGEMQYPEGSYVLRPDLRRLPMLEGGLKDARNINSRFYFDTGAGLCLLFSSHFTSDSAVFGPKKKKPVRAEGAGFGGKSEMQLTTLKTFTLGPFQFKQIPTYIFDDAYDVTSYPQLGGLIGNDLLRRFNLIINYDRSEICIIPNSSFNQPFDYSYSGVIIGLVGGKIVVTDVMKDSPGEAAGFREGDVILGINGDTKQDVQVYQGLLRTIGPRVRVVVRHNEGDVAQLSLKVKSIL
jgi:Aspartyl protease/PDZ domain